MTNFSAILVDDEQAAHYALKALLRDYAHLIHISGEALNGKQAIEQINRIKPDLIFLDIQMPDMNGFEVLRHLEYKPYIVFCTAFDQYAIDAFNENSVDYLLKPVDEKRFAFCMEKLQRLLPEKPDWDIQSLIELGNKLKEKKKATAIPIHVGQKIMLIRCEEIVYCFASEGYVSLFTTEGQEHICDLTLKQLEERLPNNFLRVQKSYIVNKDRIEEIHKYFNNRLILILNDKSHTRITTGTSYIDIIRKELEL